MQRAAMWVAGVIILVGVGSLTLRQGYAHDAVDTDRKATCSVAMLRGTYLFTGEGIVIAGQDTLPNPATGFDVYDGNGSVHAVGTFSVNGAATKARFSGTYTVNADCTGSAIYPNPPAPNAQGTFDLYIAPDGSRLTFMQTNPGFVVFGSEQRVTAKRGSD